MGRTNEKLCSSCKETKNIVEFTANKSQKTGYMSYCKSCNNARNKKYRSGPNTLERACKRIFAYLQRRTRTKKLELDFTASFLETLYVLQEGKCKYTGDILNLSSNSKKTISVDRVDSSIGYLKTNVVLTTWEVNNCKQDLSFFDFVELCRKVHSNATN